MTSPKTKFYIEEYLYMAHSHFTKEFNVCDAHKMVSFQMIVKTKKGKKNFDLNTKSNQGAPIAIN